VNSLLVAEGGGVGRCLDFDCVVSRFFTFRGAVRDDMFDGSDGIGGG
jgi:hypothetical protein